MRLGQLKGRPRAKESEREERRSVVKERKARSQIEIKGGVVKSERKWNQQFQE
jgi:hypothetical protein